MKSGFLEGAMSLENVSSKWQARRLRRERSVTKTPSADLSGCRGQCMNLNLTFPMPVRQSHCQGVRERRPGNAREKSVEKGFLL